MLTKWCSASVFYLSSSMLLLARAGAMALSGALLKRLPMMLGPLATLVYALNVAVVLSPSTGGPKPAGKKNDDARRFIAIPDEDRGSETLSDVHDARPLIQNSSLDRKSMIDYCRHTLVTVYETYLGRAVFRMSFLICFVKIIGLDVQLIQTQWSVKRYDWTFSAAAYVNAYATLVCMCVLAGLPLLSSYLLTTLGSARKMEIRILRLSLLFRIIGMLAMGFSPNKVCFLISVGVEALSAGTYDTFKAFLTGFSSTKHIAELYAVIAMVETVARMVSSQLWARVLIVSLRLDTFGMGLPFWLSACFSLCALIMIQGLSCYTADFGTPTPIQRVDDTDSGRDDN